MNLSFPIGGIDKGRATSEQPVLTSPDLNNVRPFDTKDNRIRGGQRPGLDKRFSQQIGGEAVPVVAIISVGVAN